MRYFIELSYKGTNYHGWQLQPNAISIQEVVNDVLSKILRKEINVVAAGRTDAGVHAAQSFAHFDYNKNLDVNDFIYKMNSILPDEIVVNSIFLVNKVAHTRFDALSRSYEYRIYLGRNPFLIDTTWQLNNTVLDIDKMNEAAQLLFNYKNFKCFSKTKTDVKTYNCDIKHAEWTLNDKLLTFNITADRFLRNMVRAIVGTLLEVGLNNLTIHQFKEVIESQDRTKAGKSVPSKGLFLTKIEYPKSIFINE